MKHPAALSRMPVTPLAGILALLVLFIITPTAIGQTTNPQQDPQQPTIKIPTALVNVPVMVTDNYGRFAIGLRRDNFTVVQKIEDFYSI
jgi:hypothetical protein